MQTGFRLGGAVLTALFSAFIAVLDARDAGNLAGNNLDNGWLIVIGIVSFVVLGGWQYAVVVQENKRLQESRPRLSLTLPNAATGLDVIDRQPFYVRIHNAPDGGPSLRTRVSLLRIKQVTDDKLPDALDSGWSEDINPGDSGRVSVLNFQHGSRNVGGKSEPRAEAIISLASHPIVLDLICGEPEYLLQYRVTSSNPLTAKDFYCRMQRKASGQQGWLWDIEWHEGSMPE